MLCLAYLSIIWISDSYFQDEFKVKEDLASVAYIQSGCNPPSDRDTYIKELMKHIKIDSFGPCVNNKKIPEEIDGFVKLSSEPYYHFLAKYKFQIAFENC